MFKVTLEISGVKHQKSGKTIDEALEKMGLDWNTVKAKGVITVTEGKRSHEHLFNVFQLRRIFGNKLVRNFWGKNLEYLLK